MKPTVNKIASQPSWVIRSSDVELAVTQLGGHMAPVTFYRKSDAPVRPYYISPWQNEKQAIDDPVIVPLRGDFFCLPFGANLQAYRGEKYGTHGEPAGQTWTFGAMDKCGGATSLTLNMKTRIRRGNITKQLTLVDGHTAVYCRHVLEGFTGRMPLGHHATLAMPEREASVQVATSPIKFGVTNPFDTGVPAEGSYFSAATCKKFQSLSRVPLNFASPKFGDFSAFPTRTGYTDLVGVFSKQGAKTPAWTTAVYQDEGFLWFSLKDPSVLPTTLLWISNRGRHGAPWNGRNCCLGLEEVCGFMAEGLVPSMKPNALTKAGVPTAMQLSRRRPTAVNYIQGVVRVPRGFRKVRSARFTAGQVTFTSVTGKKVATPVNHKFLITGEVC